MESAVLSRATGKTDANDARKDRRLRAVYRRELQDSVLFSALVVAAGITVETAIACVAVPRLAPLQLALGVPLIVVGLAVAHAVRCRGRRYVVALGMVVGLLPIVAAATSVILYTEAESMALACFGLIPLAFAVFIPLQRTPHVIWVALVNVVFFGTTVGMRGWTGEPAHGPALVVGATLATALSLVANEIQLRRRSQMNGQLLAVRNLFGRMKEHEIDLRRQDEFLFMQQETLVVQQAELLRLNQELEAFARLDALTGVGNRLRLNEDLAQIAARIERSGGQAGLLLIDLDRFKRLNDSAGHLAGDAALRGVADVLRRTIRAGDGVYRYGGEEFLVVLHDCDEAALEVAGQRYITAIMAAAMAHPDNPPWNVVTASAGASELSQQNCLDVDSALHDADEALYRAKKAGRNRLEVFTGPAAVEVVPMNRRRAAS
jgi:diguanylate cyclase (GGDEF)-like protein